VRDPLDVFNFKMILELFSLIEAHARFLQLFDFIEQTIRIDASVEY